MKNYSGHVLKTPDIVQKKKKEESDRQSSTAWSEYSEGSDASGLDEKPRLEGHFHHPNEGVET